MRSFLRVLLHVFFVLAATRLHPSAAAELDGIPPFVARKLELIQLLKAEEFSVLEQRVVASLDNIEGNKPGEDEDWNVLYAFSRADPEIAGPLAHWREAYPDSAPAHLAFGLYSLRLGWVVRGEKYSHYTNPHRFKEMRRYFDAAKEALRKAVTLRPKTELAWASLIAIAKTVSDRAGVESLFYKAVVHVPASSAVFGAYYSALDPKWGGSAALQTVLKQRIQITFPDNPDFAWFAETGELAEAWALYDKNDLEGALARFDNLIAKRPDADYREGRALCLFYLKRFDEAFAEMKRALAAEPGRRSFYRRLARLQQRMTDKEQWRAAERNFNIAVSLDPYDPAGLVERADFLRHLGKMKAARQDLDRALFFGALDDDVRNSRRLYFLTVGDIESALAEAEKMVALVPANPRNLYAYGSTLYTDRDCLAREVLERYTALCDAGGKCKEHERVSAEMFLNEIAELCN